MMQFEEIYHRLRIFDLFESVLVDVLLQNFLQLTLLFRLEPLQTIDFLLSHAYQLLLVQFVRP